MKRTLATNMDTFESLIICHEEDAGPEVIRRVATFYFDESALIFMPLPDCPERTEMPSHHPEREKERQLPLA